MPPPPDTALQEEAAQPVPASPGLPPGAHPQGRLAAATPKPSEAELRATFSRLAPVANVGIAGTSTSRDCGLHDL